jgi:hypothetical protein
VVAGPAAAIPVASRANAQRIGIPTGRHPRRKRRRRVEFGLLGFGKPRDGAILTDPSRAERPTAIQLD